VCSAANESSKFSRSLPFIPIIELICA
jgi:hypothetical protein